MDTDKTIKVSASNIKLAFWLVTILFFMWGVSYGLIDVMNKNFQNQLGITKATSGLLQAAYFGGYFVIATPAALVARKFGFKGGIIMGLALYAIWALLIIPASNAHSFNMFLGAFFILACGLGSLETNANPYITKLGSDKDAAFRINIAQIFNGVGQFLGPIIGGALFLSVTHGGDVADNMRSVQMVYVGIAAIIIIMLLLFAKFLCVSIRNSLTAGDFANKDVNFETSAVLIFSLTSSPFMNTYCFLSINLTSNLRVDKNFIILSSFSSFKSLFKKL